MSETDRLLAWSLIAGLVLIVLVLPWVAFSIRIRLAAPRCARCRHDLAGKGIPGASNCPECGWPLDDGGVRYGRRSVRWWWVIGFPLVLPACLASAAWFTLVRDPGARPTTSSTIVQDAIDRLLGDEVTGTSVWGTGPEFQFPQPPALTTRTAESDRAEAADELLARIGPDGVPGHLDGSQARLEELLAGKNAAAELGPERVLRLARLCVPDPVLTMRRRQPLDSEALALLVRSAPLRLDREFRRDGFRIDVDRVCLRLGDGDPVECDAIEPMRLALETGGKFVLRLPPRDSAGSGPRSPGPAAVEIDWTIDRRSRASDPMTPFGRRGRITIPFEFIPPNASPVEIVVDPARDPIRKPVFKGIAFERDDPEREDRRLLSILDLGDRLVLEGPAGDGWRLPEGSDTIVLRGYRLAWSGSWTVRTPAGERPIGLPGNRSRLNEMGLGWSTFLDRDAIAADGTITLTFTPDVDAAIEIDPLADEVWGRTMTYTLPVERKTLRWDGPPRAPRVIPAGTDSP